jgi:DeoR/GlpR family transcriptional regulator of sugar metabolism
MGQELTKRQKNIYDTIINTPYTTLQDLSELFGISESTVRREISALDQRGMVNVISGMVVTRKTVETSFEARNILRSDVKERIARAAVQFACSNESNYISGGSTMFKFAQALAQQENFTSSTIITATINIARCFQNRFDMRVIVAGGYFKDENETMQSYMTTELLKTFNYQKMFVSCAGVTADFGVMHGSPELAQMEKQVVANSREIIVVADSSKIGRYSTAALCPIQRISTLITDGAADPNALDAIRAQGVQVVTV